MRKGWEYKKFEEVFDLQMGKTPDRKNLEYFGGNNVWVSIRDLGEKEISESKEHITDVAVADTNIKVVPKGTVIMSFKLTVGKCGIASRDLYTNEAIMAFNIKDGYDINSSFLYYYLQGYQWEGANKAVMGITLNKATISKHTIAIPPLSTQQSIVAELDEINNLLRLKRKELETYDKLAQSLFYEMFGDPVENEKGWEVKKLGDICDVRDGTHDSPQYLQESPYVLITSKNIVDGEIDFNNINYISEEDFISINKRSQVEEGDIIMAMIGTIGKPIIVKAYEFKFCIKNVALIKFTKESMVSNIYIQSLLSNNSFMTYIESLNKGGTQKFIALGTIRKLNIPVPPLGLQQEYSSRLEAINKQKKLVKTAIEKLETLLAARMQYWFE